MKRKLDFLLGVPLIWGLKFFSNNKVSNPVDPKKILVIKLAAAGDTVLMVPALRALRKNYPNAQIDWWVSPINAEIAQTNPFVDKFWVFAVTGIFRVVRIVLTLRKNNYDLVIDFEQWARGTAIVSFLIGAKYRVGFVTPGQYRDALYSKSIEKSTENHEVVEFLRLIPGADLQSLDKKLELWETEAGISQVNEVLSENNVDKSKLKILIHPGCGSDGGPREWPLVNYAVLGHWLLQKYGAQIFLTAGPEEVFKSQNLKKLLNGRALDLGGRLSWNGTISLLKKMDLVLSGNTGVMHIAAALAKPQIALHGPTNPKLWGPLNAKAHIIQSDCPSCPSLVLGFEYHDKYQNCMKRIEVDTLKKAVSALIDNKDQI